MTTTTSRVQLLWLTCLSMLLKYLVLHLVGRGATLLYALSSSLLHTYILLLQCNCELTMCDLKPSCKDAHLWLLREEPEMSVFTRGLQGTNKYLDHRRHKPAAHSSDQHSDELHGGEIAYHSEMQVAQQVSGLACFTTSCCLHHSICDLFDVLFSWRACARCASYGTG